MRRNGDGAIAFDPSLPATVDGPITREEVWRIVAARLPAVHELLPSLDTQSNKLRKAQQEAIKNIAPHLRAVMRSFDAAFPLQTPEFVAFKKLGMEIGPSIDAIAHDIELQEKPSKRAAARIEATRQFAADFARLYGERATSRAVPEESPFIRFAVAFFNELGHKITAATVGDFRVSRARPSNDEGNA